MAEAMAEAMAVVVAGHLVGIVRVGGSSKGAREVTNGVKAWVTF